MLGNQFPRYQGFSLVELSIVLVILGLLVGGILGGQSLIRASELRSIVAEMENFSTAINSFREKHQALPGDLANAYQFWGAPCGTDTSDMAVGCNGDGNGYIALSGNGEGVKIWEHLALAQMIEGAFTGGGVIDGEVVLSVDNSPGSKFPQAYWGFYNSSMSSVFAPAGFGSTPDPGVYLQIGGFDTNGTGLYGIPSMSSAEAWNIDTKLDDGNGETGKVRGIDDEPCGDLGPALYGYDLDSPVKGTCVLTFILQ
jgi:prepilin-type N-terminal cleavage/methylation domain-containing protein